MIILASKSPRRKQLLGELIKDFEIIPSNVDEYLYPLDQLSLVKAKDIAKTHPSDLIISADTLVFLDGKVYGKPQNEEDAKRMLRELSNKAHEVKTIYSIYQEDKNISVTKTITSLVYFNDLSDELIDAYVASKSPLDKAGAYGVQDNDKFHIIDHIEGSYSNIVGLPVESLKEDLISIGVIKK